MAFSFTQFPADGSTNIFNFSFGFLEQTHIKAYVDGVEDTFTWLSTSSIQLATAAASLSGKTVEIRRTTPVLQPETDFADGSTLSEEELDRQTLQLLYVSQETNDAQTSSIGIGVSGQYDAESRRIINVADGAHSGQSGH